jgi:hypothetical protein
MKSNYRPHNGLDEMVRRNENRRDSNRITTRFNYPVTFKWEKSTTTISRDGHIKTVVHETR